MAKVWVYGDTVGPGRCRDERCGAAITWAELVSSGRKMCFEGELVAIRTSEEHGRQTWEVDLETNHWRSCPGASNFRRATD